MKTRYLLIPFALGLGLALLWAWRGESAPAVAAPVLSADGPSVAEGPRAEGHIEPPNAPAAELHVCPSGCAYASIQDAVDAASDGDVIKVAAGTYTGVQARAAPAGYYRSDVITQVVYIDKSITLRGGYTTAFADPPDPEANLTTLDAQGQGRVLLIAGNITPTVEGFRITGGDAAGLGGVRCCSIDLGGGVYVLAATVTISHNQVIDNAADYGGGLSVYQSDATLSANTVSSNTAEGEGGGLLLWESDAMLSGNVVASNTALSPSDWGAGGGLSLELSNATLAGNTIVSNTAPDGGGLILNRSNVVFTGNTITDNTARRGGGLILAHTSNVTLTRNRIANNTAENNGGGLYMEGDPVISGNRITSNTAGSRGGGLYMSGSAMLSGNTIAGNTASEGGGLYLRSSRATLVNNVIADNQASAQGSGLYIWSSSPRLLHTTIAHNGGSGIYVTTEFWADPTLALTNTILVGHSVGISVTGGNSVTINGVLWHQTPVTVSRSPTSSVRVEHQHVGDPAFVALLSSGQGTEGPRHYDYHIGPASAAVDAGVASGVLTDMDGDARPTGFGFDIGADERPGTGLRLHKAAAPSLLNAGQSLTYTLVVSSTGAEAATGVRLTDTLPGLQRAVSITASQGSCAPGAGWGGTAACDLGTLPPGASARVTLTAQVSPQAWSMAQLPWVMRNTAWVRAAEASNTGTVDTTLHDCHVRLNEDPVEYATVQAGVDASTQASDVVKVSGYCVGVASRAGLPQIVYLD